MSREALQKKPGDWRILFEMTVGQSRKIADGNKGPKKVINKRVDLCAICTENFCLVKDDK